MRLWNLASAKQVIEYIFDYNSWVLYNTVYKNFLLKLSVSNKVIFKKKKGNKVVSKELDTENFII